jgi:hypothetical protein
VPGRVDLIRNAGIANAGILEDGKIRFTYDPKWDARETARPAELRSGGQPGAAVPTLIMQPGAAVPT